MHHEDNSPPVCRHARRCKRGSDGDLGRGQRHDAQDDAGNGHGARQVSAVHRRRVVVSRKRHGVAQLAEPPTAESLRGKVVLIDVWTYTCINWLRTAAYVRAWAEKYKDRGLVVIGVHAPEFPFERNVDNVRRAVQAMGLTYPIAIDNDFAIWRAFQNQYLAGTLSRRCAGPHAASSFRRRWLRAVGKVHSETAGRGRNRRHRPGAGFSRRRWRRSRRRLGQLAVSGKLPGL